MIVIDKTHVVRLYLARPQQIVHNKINKIHMEVNKSLVLGFLIDYNNDNDEKSYLCYSGIHNMLIITLLGKILNIETLPKISTSFIHGVNIWEKKMGQLLKADFDKNNCTIVEFLKRKSVSDIGLSYELFDRKDLDLELTKVKQTSTDYNFKMVD